ncbi:uncharacterized protein LOC127811404 isoform X3 [Diospyros lotus]|uniref:uncharacterized protein LOC127811404 isoform X3 n=1 Tax=Diospyros lotus TaxID=55363 RepID=UPI00225167D8|nr:uncharacterized protein LOC127811404 isoform X3 [Diospyros lotus]XP_052207193.1 uncharacterized protein LOC127811404 isoform X3 [Diospyros lotus]XP_052207194.1 uncharacterized protein LOC127811404 isoform X3 [Diospyros lotus]XP_052207195.1 uncharacterized protein LOC127811404 isoform X3 [Diospyros lotus]
MALSISSHPLTSPSSSSTSYSQLPKSTVPRETLIALRFQRRSPLSFGHLRHSLGPMNSQRTTCHASPTTSPPANIGRVGEVKRVTKETDVSVRINLDGSGEADSSTGIPFLDHMLDQLASHGLFDVHVKATGDTHIDDHHTNEDVALAIGTALLQALGDRRGINRFGDFSAPLDEALIHVSLDLSGRPHLSYGLQIPTQRVGTYDTQGKKCCTSFLNAACENEYYCLSSCFLAFYNLFPVIIKSRELIALDENPSHCLLGLHWVNSLGKQNSTQTTCNSWWSTFSSLWSILLV